MGNCFAAKIKAESPIHGAPSSGNLFALHSLSVSLSPHSISCSSLLYLSRFEFKERGDSADAEERRGDPAVAKSEEFRVH